MGVVLGALAQWLPPVAAGTGYPRAAFKAAGASDQLGFTVPFPVTMRTTPTATRLGTWGLTNCTGPTVNTASPDGASLYILSVAAGACVLVPDSSDDIITADAEL